MNIDKLNIGLISINKFIFYSLNYPTIVFKVKDDNDKEVNRYLPDFFTAFYGESIFNHFADKWVDKYGDWSFFICRMLPVVRTFISFPAGILKARKRIFFTLTFLGSLVWSYLLVYVGVKMGENMEAFKHIWHKFDIAIVAICVVLGVAYLYKHFKHLND